MKILTRYILKEILIFFGISLAAFLGVLLTVQMLRMANLIISKGILLSQIGLVFVSIIPRFLEFALPMATLLGVMLAFARLSGDSEIIVIRAIGISLKQMLKPVIIFGVMMSLLTLYVSIELKPWGASTLKRVLFEIARTKSSSGLEQGVFNKLGAITLYADTIDYESGRLKNVLIDDKRGSVRQLIIGSNGEILTNDERQTITVKIINGEIHEIIEGKYVFTKFDTNSLIILADELYGAEESKQRKKSSAMRIPELKQHILTYQTLLERVRSSPSEQREILLKELALQDDPPQELSTQNIKQRINRLKIELDSRFSMPVACIVLALLAMPLGIQPPRLQRTWGAGLSASIGLLTFLLYWALLSFGIAFGQSGAIPTLIAVWLPNLAGLLLAVYAIRHMGSERWQSVAHGVEILALKLAARFNKQVEQAI